MLRLCDNSFRGSYDTFRLEFPVDWLFKTEDELEQLVLGKEKAEWEAKEKAKQEAEEKKQMDVKRQNYEQYLKLKLMFEDNNK